MIDSITELGKWESLTAQADKLVWLVLMSYMNSVPVAALLAWM